MRSKTREKGIYGAINIKTFEITLFTTKNQVAKLVGCGRNFLNTIESKLTYGDFIIFFAIPHKCERRPPNYSR
jgi:hypothetical protein